LTRGKILHEIDIAIQKIVSSEVLNFLPANLFEDEVARLALELADLVEDQLDRSAPRVGVFVSRDLFPACRGDRKLFHELPLERRSEFLPRFHLAAREFPFAAVWLPCPTLADQNRFVPHDNGRDDVHASKWKLAVTLLYSERLIDHFQNPRNVGELPPPAVTVEATNPACGDILRLSVRFEAGVVAEVRYKTRGCTASIAAGSALTEWLAGKSKQDLSAFRPAVIEELIGELEPESKHVAILCATAIQLLRGAG
jgi:nitrogen fixation protein NifU and related proteins